MPVPGGPTNRTPLGILAPRLLNFSGDLRNSLISSSSSFASSAPATSLKVTLGNFSSTSFALDLPNCMTWFPLDLTCENIKNIKPAINNQGKNAIRYSWKPAGSVSVVKTIFWSTNIWKISPSNPSGYSVWNTFSSLIILKWTVFDCSFIVASTTSPLLINSLNSEKVDTVGEFIVWLYCWTPKNINKPKATYIKKGFVFFFSLSSIMF